MLGLTSVLAATQTLQVKNAATLLQQVIDSGSESQAEDLAAKLKSWYGKGIEDGGYPKFDETTVIWAMEAKATPSVIAEDGTLSLTLTRLGKTDVYAAVSHFRSGRGFRFHYRVGAVDAAKGFLEVYDTEPDMFPQPNVPKGKLTKMPAWKSRIFPGTTRDWWVYVPPGLHPYDQTDVMVFQDGQSMIDYVPTCLDNLINKGEIPPMVGIFINSGTKVKNQSNRSFEYDTLSDTYARFLTEEILPTVNKMVPLTHDPNKRAICGLSSGGICAFTVAWQRPNEFRKVLSSVGSFTDIAHGSTLKDGGHNYPFLIRLSTPKPLRVYLQDGINDLDNQFGNWPLANQSMAKALAFKGYDYTFTLGEGTHSDRQFRAILPDMLKWLWR